MLKQFKPSALTTIITTAAFSLFCIVAFSQPGGFPVGCLFLLIPVLSIAIFITNYRKYVVTDDNLQVVDWFGSIKFEIQFRDMANVILHKGFRTEGVNLKVDVDVIILVIDLKDKLSERFDLSNIFEYQELVSLVKSRWENVR